MDEDTFPELFPDCERGVIPPFGELYGVPVYLEVGLADDPEISLRAGTHSDCVRMGNVDFLHLAEPRVCSFAEKASPVARSPYRVKDCDPGSVFAPDQDSLGIAQRRC